MTRTFSRRTACALFAALLSGCAALPEAATVRRGRFALRASGPAGAESHNGRFELTRSPGLLRLDLLTPLSGILARIEVTPRGASFARSLSETPVERPDVDALLTELIGFTLPVEPLAELLDDRGGEGERLVGDWRARILALAPDGTPRRLRLDRDARGAAPAVSLTVFVEPS